MVARLAVVALLASGALAAQRPSDLVRWSARPAAATARAGTTLTIGVTASIESGWHIYAMSQPASGPVPMAIALPAAPGFQLLAKRIESPLPIVTHDPTFQADTHSYEDQAAFAVPIAVSSDAKPGKHPLAIEITYQACSNRICLRPFTETLAVEVTVAPPTKGRRQ